MSEAKPQVSGARYTNLPRDVETSAARTSHRKKDLIPHVTPLVWSRAGKMEDEYFLTPQSQNEKNAFKDKRGHEMVQGLGTDRPPTILLIDL